MKASRAFGSAATIAAALALIASAPAVAADFKLDRATRDTPSQQTAQSGFDAAALQRLQRRLDDRDELILDLLDRVERLERQVSIPRSSFAPPVDAAGNGTARGSLTFVTDEAPQPRPQSAQQAAPPQPAPGEFQVSEEDAQRALERALVQAGASLLFPGKFELVPSLNYQFRQFDRPSQLALTIDGNVLITEDVTRSTQLEASALFRAGLPWDTQVEIGLPYDYRHISTASRVLGSNLGEQTTSANGYGDPTLSLTKQVLREGEWRPGLFLSGTWDSDLGQTKDGIPLGSGFNEIRAGMTAVKRQDPLVFTAGFTYQTALESNNLTPGDQYTPAVGMLFAVSPETSLRFAQQISFINPIKVGGNDIQGSDQTQGIFTAGLLSILARGVVLDFSVSIGETPDAPDLSFRLAFPIRLN